MNPVEIITKKRDGEALEADEIRFFIQEFVADKIPDYQMAALAMAIYFQDMTDVETTALTQAMAESGEMLDPKASFPAETIIVDKHSSGGVGDKTSLVVGPIVAACGLPVGKMSGRGLGFTGGTLDKLESISGWHSELSEAHFQQQLQRIGLVIAGQTTSLAPADKRLYALRDVTGTVSSLPLIASSIMSKKLAAGADAIVLDVKCGRGAFMETEEQAKMLAHLMVAIGNRAGRKMTALITQMNQPLGQAIGNALEVKEAIATLHGNGPEDFTHLVTAIASEMLALGTAENWHSDNGEQIERSIKKTIESGSAFEKFEAFVSAQGGDIRMVQKPDKLPTAPITRLVKAKQKGYVKEVYAREMGLAVMALGGGRQKKEDTIDYRVGVICHVKVGDPVEPETPLYTVHAGSELAADTFIHQIEKAYQISEEPTPALPIIHEIIHGHLDR